MKFSLPLGSFLLCLLAASEVAATPLQERHHEENRWCKAKTKTIVRTSWIPKTTTIKTRNIYTTKTYCPNKKPWHHWTKAITSTSTLTTTSTTTLTSLLTTTTALTPPPQTLTLTITPSPDTKTITTTLTADPKTEIVTLTETATPSTVVVTVTVTTSAQPTPTQPACQPDGAQCSLFDPGACCGMACMNAQPFPTCFSFY